MKACIILATLLVVASLCSFTEAKVATLALDLGSEWIKAALVKPGVPMDIVLNRESKRKTASIVAIRNGERTFGLAALSTATKFPSKGFRYLSELLGHTMDSEVVARYQKHFPEHTLEGHPTRNTVMFRIDAETVYSVEELYAMILQHVVELGAEYAEQPISSVVLAIPPYFAQPERRALLAAAELANIKVTRLLTSPVSVSLNYGVFRRNDFNATVQHILLYDMGSTSTIAAIAGFSVVKDKETKLKTPQVEIKGIGFDRTLGGFEWDVRLRDFLMADFKERYAAKLKKDPAENPRALAKLLAEAQKVKTVLSANTETFAQVEGLFEEVDYRAKVTRETLESLAADLYDRVAAPVSQALESAGMSIAEIEMMSVIGGSVRMPRVQDILTAANDGRELGKNLNGDEACALGASYEAAVLSKAFRVKKFLTRDANVYPITVTFNKAIEAEDGSETYKTISKTIFPRNNPIPQRKVLSFNKFTDDFSFDVNYGDLSFLPSGAAAAFGLKNISTIQVSGVAEAFEANSNLTVLGVKAHFVLDDSGLVHVDKVDANFEALPEPEEDEEVAEEELAKDQGEEQGDGKTSTSEENTEAPNDKDEQQEDEKQEKKEKQEEDAEESRPEEEPAAESDAAASNGEGEEEADEEDAGDVDGDSEQASSTGSESANESGEDGTDKAEKADVPAADKEQKKAKKPRQVRVSLNVGVAVNDLADLTTEEKTAAIERLEDMRTAEIQKRLDDEARNGLETFIYGVKDKLWDDIVRKCSTDEEREAYNDQLTEVGDWLYEDGFEANATVYNAKLKELNDTGAPIFFRASEYKARPAAVKSLVESLNRTRVFIDMVRNETEQMRKQEAEEEAHRLAEEEKKVIQEDGGQDDEEETNRGDEAADDADAAAPTATETSDDDAADDVDDAEGNDAEDGSDESGADADETDKQDEDSRIDDAEDGEGATKDAGGDAEDDEEDEKKQRAKKDKKSKKKSKKEKKKKEWISDSEVEALETMANNTQRWLDEKTAEQAEKELTETPAFKVSAVNAKARRLDSEVYRLLKRPRPSSSSSSDDSADKKSKKDSKEKKAKKDKKGKKGKKGSKKDESGSGSDDKATNDETASSSSDSTTAQHEKDEL